MSKTLGDISKPYPDDCWYALAPVALIGKSPVSFEFLGNEIILRRLPNGTAVALAGRCAHRGCSMAKGWITADRLVCPYHGWQYDQHGICAHIPSLRQSEVIPSQAKVHSYPVRELHGLIWLWLSSSASPPSDNIPDIPELIGQQIHSGGDISFTYDTHYTRTLENGIDPTHAAFVHGKSIGRVDPNVDLSLGPYEIVESHNSFYARMPIKVKKLNGLAKFVLKGDADSVYKEYRYIFPNLVISTIHFGKYSLSALQAHVPESAFKTTVRVTNARSFLHKTPLLSQWFDGVSSRTGVQISTEDSAVISYQLPPQVAFKGSHEVLVRSDEILIAFRRMMHGRLSVV
jgi:phenylpropionate dioxygenase-like ring-hydroxylating dioxygenase large terminal subunit